MCQNNIFHANKLVKKRWEQTRTFNQFSLHVGGDSVEEFFFMSAASC